MTSNARLKSVLSTAVDGIIVIDCKGKILLYNKACEHLFGYSGDEILGKNVSILMPKEQARKHDGFILRYVETGEATVMGSRREVKARCKNGMEFPVELSVGDASTPEGQQFVGILRDLRPKKRSEARIHEMQADLIKMTRVNALDEMGAAIAHEVNQPLTAIMLYLQTAARRAKAIGKEDEQLNLLMQKAVDEARRASGIIQRMRNFVEKQGMVRESCVLLGVIQECLNLISLGYKDSKVTFRTDFEDEDLSIEMDVVQVQQILINLIRNGAEAVKTCDVKDVCVYVERDGTDVLIKVTDSGPGIKDKAAAYLFKAFSGTKRRGMGVGLAISRSIAQNHRGDLYVEPFEEGKGATFVLRLPTIVMKSDTESVD
ncbi:two-component system sensor histidine kinase NtrB [Flexibacterium corallicola]|uniref:two-component system sensor histidine kinase NtrB n=1 Tax=Flexibacterium corallicola TaxID=3037259 RepID=UPI00286F678B|nr:PAS domain S-box protein [Pseudovibrio sp. M1P-2-3]